MSFFPSVQRVEGSKSKPRRDVNLLPSPTFFNDGLLFHEGQCVGTASIVGQLDGPDAIKYDLMEVTLNSGRRIAAFRESLERRSAAVCQDFSRTL